MTDCIVLSGIIVLLLEKTVLYWGNWVSVVVMTYTCWAVAGPGCLGPAARDCATGSGHSGNGGNTAKGRQHWALEEQGTGKQGNRESKPALERTCQPTIECFIRVFIIPVGLLARLGATTGAVNGNSMTRDTAVSSDPLTWCYFCQL